MNIMYHHFSSSPNTENVFFHHQTLQSFEQQILNVMKIEKKFTVSFDDGLRTQLYPANFLKKLQISGSFYYNGLPLIESKICMVHKIQMLLKVLGKNEKQNLLNDGIQLIKNDDDDFMFVYRKQNAKDIDTKIKVLFNYKLDYKKAIDIVDYYFKAHFGAEKDLVKSIYMSVEELKELRINSHKVLPHFYSHRLLGPCDESSVTLEFEKTMDIHQQIFGESPDEICVPYGSTNSWNQWCTQATISNYISTVVFVDNWDGLNALKSPELSFITRTDACTLTNFEYIQ